MINIILVELKVNGHRGYTKHDKDNLIYFTLKNFPLPLDLSRREAAEKNFPTIWLSTDNIDFRKVSLLVFLYEISVEGDTC